MQSCICQCRFIAETLTPVWRRSCKLAGCWSSLLGVLEWQEWVRWSPPWMTSWTSDPWLGPPPQGRGLHWKGKRREENDVMSIQCWHKLEVLELRRWKPRRQSRDGGVTPVQIYSNGKGCTLFISAIPATVSTCSLIFLKAPLVSSSTTTVLQKK